MEVISNKNVVLGEHLKQELEFKINNFNEPSVLTGKTSLAKLIQNLMLIQPGTYPDAPLLGINIGKYQFETLDSSTLSRIESEIRSQTSTFIPGAQVDYIHVETFYNETKEIKNTLGIAISMSDGQEVFLVLKQDKQHNIVSQTFI